MHIKFYILYGIFKEAWNIKVKRLTIVIFYVKKKIFLINLGNLQNYPQPSVSYFGGNLLIIYKRKTLNNR